MKRLMLSTLLLLLGVLAYSKEYRQVTYKSAYWRIEEKQNTLLKEEFAQNEFVVNPETSEVTCIISGIEFKTCILGSTVQNFEGVKRFVIWTEEYEMYVYDDCIIIAFNNEDRYFYQFTYK